MISTATEKPMTKIRDMEWSTKDAFVPSIPACLKVSQTKTAVRNATMMPEAVLMILSAILIGHYPRREPTIGIDYSVAD
jgi:hypothetical protein